ncbi:hypothetical protein [Rouxiella aceris]|nr:hypothetical protein [Rouxiella aceris]
MSDWLPGCIDASRLLMAVYFSRCKTFTLAASQRGKGFAIN